MPHFTVHVAKTNLSKLIEKACAGEDIVIARGAEPVVRLVPIGNGPPCRAFGALKGELRVGAAFFEPLPANERTAWE